MRRTLRLLTPTTCTHSVPSDSSIVAFFFFCGVSPFSDGAQTKGLVHMSSASHLYEVFSEIYSSAKEESAFFGILFVYFPTVCIIHPEHVHGIHSRPRLGRSLEAKAPRGLYDHGSGHLHLDGLDAR